MYLVIEQLIVLRTVNCSTNNCCHLYNVLSKSKVEVIPRNDVIIIALVISLKEFIKTYTLTCIKRLEPLWLKPLLNIALRLTKWLGNFFYIWPFKTMKICLGKKTFTKLGSNVFQTQNKPWKYCRKSLKFCQSAEILSNLVTLNAHYLLSGIVTSDTFQVIICRYNLSTYLKQNRQTYV